MKSVGEAMAIGRNYSTALQKALRSLEKRGSSFHWGDGAGARRRELLEIAKVPDRRPHRHRAAGAARRARRVEEVFEATKIDPWFLDQIVLINEVADEIAGLRPLRRAALPAREGPRLLRRPDRAAARPHRARGAQRALAARACGRSSRPSTPARASSRPSRRTTTRATTSRPRCAPSDARKVVILGSGPNRIGQGVEFDYSCVHASFALHDAGFETIMINCNPETVSTDYDTSDRLYFEPLTLEDVLEVIHAESQSGELVGVIVQLGGQTALGLAKGLEAAGVPILGTTPERDRPRRGARPVLGDPRRRRPARAEERHRDRRAPAPSRSPRRSATRCSCARASCSAAAAWRSSTTPRASRTTSTGCATRPSSAPARRCSSTASSTTRSRSTSTRSTTAPSSTSAASWSTSRRPASTPATPPAPCRR